MVMNRRSRLGIRISVLVLGLVIAAIAIPSIVSGVTHDRELREKMIGSAIGSAELIALSSTDALLADDLDRLRAFVATFKHESPEVTQACFVDRTGNVVAHSSPDAEGTVIAELKEPPRARRSKLVEHSDGDSLVVTVPIRLSGEPWGAFQAELSLASVDAAMRAAAWRTATIGSALLLLGILASSRLARWIARPVERLAEVAADVAAGNLGARSGIVRDDEIGALAGSFDVMTGKLQEQNVALRSHSELLEVRVQERTELLHLKETLLRSMAEASPVALLVIDHDDDRILYCNRRLSELWGLAQPFAEWTGGDWQEGLLPRLSSRLREGETRGAALLAPSAAVADVTDASRAAAEAVFEDEVRLADGRILKVFRSPVADDRGRAIGHLFLFEDVTVGRRAAVELARARDEALEAARLKSEFLANMSHEIRTPMNGVLGFVELLAATALDSRQRDYLETVRTSGETLLAILNDILDFSKIEAGRVELESIDFDPRQVVEGVADLLAPRAQEKGLEFLANVGAAVPARLRGDPTRLRQIVLNLVGNAIKFTESGEVAVESGGAPLADGRFEWSICVRDTGIGIPRERIGQLFEAFVQADGSTTRRFGGTGLGLAISRRLVTRMGGTLEVASEDGRGTCFTVRVALAIGGTTAVRASHEEMRGARILVVDDNATNRLLVQELLAGVGATVVGVSSGHEAIATARAAARSDEPFCAVLLDMQMPGMDGLELSRQMGADPRVASAPRILLTSMMLATTIDAAAHGLCRVLTKPIKRATLIDALVAALGRTGHGTATDGAGAAAASGTAGSLSAVLGAVAFETSGIGVRVLLAEDHPVNQKLAKALLARAGAAVSVANDGREAVEIWERGGIDLVLMDVQMPVMDGEAATRRIRELEAAGCHTPIVALTANAMAGDRERYLTAGMDDYLSKPLRPAELARVLQKWGRRQSGEGGAGRRQREAGRAIAETAETTEEVLEESMASPASAAAMTGQEWQAMDATGSGMAKYADVLERLREIGLMDDASLLVETIELFVTDAAATIRQMQQAFTEGDAGALERCSHRLKGSALNLGVATVAQWARSLEENAHRGEFAGAPESLAALESELQGVGEWLRQLASETQAKGA